MISINVRFQDPDEVLDFVNKAEKYPYAMDATRGSIVVDGKSLLGLMNIGFNQIVSVRIYAEECGDFCREIAKYTVSDQEEAGQREEV
ncbi:MAG: HPr family phosphocarrier protein [Clostridiales bacterium]|nr:HPr family phosphocarrier protein [Clostridiales bacterium]